VESLDLNVRFYDWLLSDKCALLCRELLESSLLSPEKRDGYSAIFESVAEFRADVQSLRSTADCTRSDDYLVRNFRAVQSLETYLGAVSEAAQTFRVSAYHFELESGNLRVKGLEERLERPSPLIYTFLSDAVDQIVLPGNHLTVGLSCIGQEQLYFSLLLGKLIKERSAAPILVGGTIFSRIFERGALQASWFGRYFDIIVRNEGEKPVERLLRNLKDGRDIADSVPGIVHLHGGAVTSTEPCAPLSVAELPTPDFSGLSLPDYLSPEITLPLLSARGCYWGKCEFCHHGMVYGEKYAAYKVPTLLDTVRELSEKYGVRHFAFNDEALPPTSARSIAREFPPHSETGWTFTGLIKFERSYTRSDFDGLHASGFRSLYVGLESASERVLDLMKKRSKRETIVKNLTDATSAGIWMHCFLFFGFPGETHDDARQTYDFVRENPDIISSYGAGAFSLEHNAPIFRHYKDFGIRLKATADDSVDVYYDYDVEGEVGPKEALEWCERLSEATRHISQYRSTQWVPRELLLCVLSRMTPADLRVAGQTVHACGGMPASTRLHELLTRVSVSEPPGSQLVVNRLNGKVLRAQRGAIGLFDFLLEHDISLGEVGEQAPALLNKLAFLGEDVLVKSTPPTIAAP